MNFLKLGLLLLCLFAYEVGLAQMSKIVSTLPEITNNEGQLVKVLTGEQKLQMLSLVEGDSVQFRTYQQDDEYYRLDWDGLRFLDLDSDGDLDLLYSGQNGTQVWLKDTKAYLNENGRLQFLKQIPGDIVSINAEDGVLEITTQWSPCCDSYTSRRYIHLFSKSNKGRLKSSLAVIGRIKPVDFEGLERSSMDSIKLYAFGLDFRGTHPYFKDRNKEIQPLLRSKKPILLLSMPGTTKVGLISKQEINGEKWVLVITDPLNDVPNSLYERSRGNQRRFIGWVREHQLR